MIDAAKREVEEETGIELDQNNLINLNKSFNITTPIGKPPILSTFFWQKSIPLPLNYPLSIRIIGG